MKRRVFRIMALAMLCALLTVCAFAADVVYLDGTGKTDGAETDLKSAVSALPNGGTVIVSGDTTVGTANTGVTLSAVGGKVTITSENGAVLTIARSLTLASELEFDNIRIHSTATESGNVLCRGHKLTMGAGVTVTKASGAFDLALFGGASGGTVTYNSHLVLRGGTWRAVYGGSYAGTFNGTSTVEVSNVTVLGTLSAGNWSGTYNGTPSLTADLRGGKTVTAGTYKETPVFLVDEGYEAVLNNGVYSQQRVSLEPAPTTVYVDGTGKTEGAYTTFEDAFKALSSEGGTVIVSGDTQLGTTASGVVMANYKDFTGKITFTSENGAKLIFARSLRLNCEVEFKNIHIHSIIPSNLSAVNNILACGNKITVGDGVTMTHDDGTLYPCIIGGRDANTTYDSHIIVKGGTWQNIYGGGYSGTFAGNSTVEVSNATVIGTLTAGSRSGTFSGTGTLTLDLRGNKTVTAGTFAGTPTCLVDEGYEAVLVGNTYLQRLPVDMTPKTVYLDGTGKTEGAYTTFAEALASMPGGGTIVVCGDIYVNNAVTLATGGEILITSVYDGEDYTDSAAIKVANNIELGCDVTFKDVVLEKAATGDDYIFANGHALVIDEGVYCRNVLATRYITLVGGAQSGTLEADSSVTVKSGYFRNIFGGNHNGTFKGTSTVNFLGGYVDNMVAGGTFMGNFEGTSTVNVGGDAVVVYSASGSGVQGGNCGSGNDPYTFNGEIYLNLFGKARVNQNVYGTSRWPNVTTTADVYITVKDDAFVYQNLYAGGYGGTLNGNTKVVMDGGWVGVNLAAGNRSGTVNGDTYLEINGGKVNYYATNIHSSVSEPAGSFNVAGGGLTGAVNGNTTVVVNGGDIYGNVYGGAIETGTVSGNSTVTLMGGSIWCGAYADGATAGTVSGTKMLNIDLSAGGSLALGMAADVDTLTGGGALTLFPEAVITADSFRGNVALSINGRPQARNYVTAATTENASVTYTARGSEQFVSADGVYGISSVGYYATTRVTFKHYPGVQIYPRAGLVTTGDRIPATLAESEQSVFDFAPGLYNFAVYHTQDDYKRKYIYITGEEETLTLDLTSYTPMVGGGFESSHFYENSDEIHKTFYNTDELVGFARPDSPFFNNDRDGQRLFTSNVELVEFVNAKVGACDYAYAFDLFTSPAGNTIPLVLFTKDEIPAGASLAEAAEIVSAPEGRDIMMVTAIVHGNEPSAGEGALAMISELCGTYGDTLLTGNVGAVIIVPRLNPDGCENFTRETPNGVTVDSGKKINNLNRDYAMLTSAEISGVVHAFDLFAPTVLIDCHEAGLTPVFGDSGTFTDVYDVGIMSAGTLNTPFVDATAAIKGNYADRGMRTAELLTEALHGIEETGLRGYYYQTPMTFPANNTPYGLTNGAYTFLIEVPGISGGDGIFARRVFAHVTAIKEIFALAAESNGQLAAEVGAARDAVALSAQVFDVDTPIVLHHNYTRHDSSTLLWNNPLVAADATVRRAENVTKYYLQDMAIKYRARPTAYAVSASADGIEKVLPVLDTHGIAYTLLDAGTTLTLKQYAGNATTATLGAATAVTFTEGVYLIPVDGYKAYLIASLFEPECPDSGEEISTFVQAGYLAASDIYRSEENYIAAKLGIAGTYYAFAKPVASVIADGAAATVITDGGVQLIKTPKSSAVVTYADGTEETIRFSNHPGDLNGDGTVSVADVLMLLRAVLNDRMVAGGDLNGDGALSLLDVVRVMRLCCAQ